MIRATLTVGLTLALSAACLNDDRAATSRAVGADGDLAMCIGPEPFVGPTVSLPELFALLTDVGTLQAQIDAEVRDLVISGQPLPPISELASTQFLYTGAWTNWSDETTVEGLVKLAVMRGILNKIAAHNTYLPGALIGNADPSMGCPPQAAIARTADGTCNDPANPLMGAANTRFGRNMPLWASHPDQALLEPNPREISRKVLRRKSQKEMDFLNMLGAAWTQFQIHDWFSHGANDPTGIIDVPLSEDDPLRERWGLETLSVRRTSPDPTRQPEEAALPPTYLNTVTQWWDGSQIYGSDQATQDRLRSHLNGRLRLTDAGMLPERDGRSDAGFTDNWWAGLELLHTLFAREHNAIADMLLANNPDWDDDRLFDTARLINTALIARIHTVEWTPAILPNPTLEVGMHTNWNGLNQFVTPPFPGSHPDPAVNTVINGIVGNGRELGGVPYFLTEEFVSVYRMHPMLPERLALLDLASGHTVDNVPTEDTRNGDARALVTAQGMTNLLYSFGSQSSGALVLENYPKFLQDLITPIGVIDMGTIDILRDRERGIPRFNNARRLIGLKAVTSFEELTGGDQGLAKALAKVYDGDIEMVDFMVGMFAEGVRPDCYGFSETAFQIFTLMATRRLQTDRFYTDDYRAEIYTAEGIDWVEGNTMKSVLLRHFPELGDTGLADTSNAFMPWR